MNLHSKTKKIERALIAVTFNGVPVILATDGATIACECENVSCYADEIGLCTKELKPGLYLWTGTASLEYECWEATTPTELTFTGEILPVRPDEIAELYAMEPPTPIGEQT